MKDFRVYLRALELDDYKTTIKWRKDDEIWSMVGGTKYFVSEAYEKKWIEERIFSKDYITLALSLKGDSEIIGLISFANMDYKNRSIQFYGKMIAKEHWGKGYATEMLMLAFHYVFYDLGFNRIYGRQLANSDYSMKVNEKCGAKVEGILRQAQFKDGSFVDVRIFSILREDFDKVLNYNGY